MGVSNKLTSLRNLRHDAKQCSHRYSQIKSCDLGLHEYNGGGAARRHTMDAGTARSLIAKYMTLLARLDIVERVEPVLSENDLIDPDLEVDACMDHRIPAGASVEPSAPGAKAPIQVYRLAGRGSAAAAPFLCQRRDQPRGEAPGGIGARGKDCSSDIALRKLVTTASSRRGRTRQGRPRPAPLTSASLEPSREAPACRGRRFPSIRSSGAADAPASS